MEHTFSPSELHSLNVIRYIVATGALADDNQPDPDDYLDWLTPREQYRAAFYRYLYVQNGMGEYSL